MLRLFAQTAGTHCELGIVLSCQDHPGQFPQPCLKAVQKCRERERADTEGDEKTKKNKRKKKKKRMKKNKKHEAQLHHQAGTKHLP